jgi:hypothetical protein
LRRGPHRGPPRRCEALLTRPRAAAARSCRFTSDDARSMHHLQRWRR